MFRVPTTMSSLAIRVTIAVICLLMSLGIITGAWLEIARARRGESLLAVWQLRLRLISAFIWILVLFAVSCLVVKMWPTPLTTKAEAVEAAKVLAGIVSLIAIAMVLLAVDMVFLTRARLRAEHGHNLRLAEDFKKMADAAAAKAGKLPPSDIPNSHD